jgi:hypothetical protein
MLYGNGKCYTHTKDVDLSIGVRTSGESYMPSELYRFSSTVNSDIRISETQDCCDAILVMAELEIIVKDNDGDPIQTFEYSQYPDSDSITNATEDALEWISNNS